MADRDREEACGSVPVPATIVPDVQGYRWSRDKIGESGGAIYRLHGRPNAPDLFLKWGRGTVADDVTDEMVRLRWLAEHLSVPNVVQFVRSSEEAWLLMTAMPGRTAHQVLEANASTRIEVVDALARFLRRLHAIPVAACPFNSDHAFRLARARMRIDANLVDTNDFDREREGWTAEAVWAELQALLPLAPDPVVTHGDFSLDNIMIYEGEVAGCIDVGRAGVADRYQDLAILWNCLGEFGAQSQARLLQQYAIGAFDERQLHFHLMLDELF